MFFRLHNDVPIEGIKDRDQIHPHVDAIVYYIEDLKKQCGYLNDVEKQTQQDSGFTLKQKIQLFPLFVIAKIHDGKVDNNRLKNNKQNFEIAIKSINADPTYFYDYSRKRIVKELKCINNEIPIKLKKLFIQKAGDHFIKLLNIPQVEALITKDYLEVEEIKRTDAMNYRYHIVKDYIKSNGSGLMSFEHNKAVKYVEENIKVCKLID